MQKGDQFKRVERSLQNVLTYFCLGSAVPIMAPVFWVAKVRNLDGFAIGMTPLKTQVFNPLEIIAALGKLKNSEVQKI